MKTVNGTLYGIALILFLCGGFVFAAQTIQLNDSPDKIEILDNTESGVRLQVDIGAIEFTPVTTDRGTFMLATAKGLARSQRIGEPSLPTANRLLSIPYGCDPTVEVERYTVEEYSLADYGITDPILPVQPSLSKSQDPRDVPFEMDDDVYATAGYYALPLATTDVLGEMRGLRIGRLSVSPIQYDPVAGKIKVYKDITVRVDFKNADWTGTYEGWDRYYSPYFEPVYNCLANFREPTTDKADLTKYPVKYVIVADRMFEAQLAPFIEWKTKKGFTVVTAYTDAIGTTSAAVKAYLQGLYNAATPEDPAPSFVLFVGDAQQIPPFDEGEHFSDLRLCEFTGDYFPEIYYGRFSAQTTAQLQPQIDKTMEYEQYLMPDPSYLAEVTLVSGVDASHASTYGNGQINYGTSLYFNAAHGITPNVWLYPASSGSVESAVIQTFNDGVSIANYTAHCGHDGWSDPDITSSDISALTNNHKWLLEIGNCCLSNTFATDYSTPCFGETWLQAPDKGGIGAIGGTNSTYWDEDYWWGVGNGPIVGSGPTYEQTGLGAYDGMFHDHGEATTDYYVANGAVIYRGNLAVTEAASSRTEYYWEIYCLMGDPSVMTYLGVPTVNSVSYPATLVLSEPSVTVSAVPGSYVGISMNGELHGQAYIGSTGSETIPLTPFATPGVADIVITAQNRQPVIATIQIITPNGPYVIYDGNTLNDDAGGNGNGLLDFGETLTLDMQAKNVGPDEAVNVSGQLTSTDPYVTITDDLADFGTIPGDNGTSLVVDAYAFKVQSAVPDGHIIPFTVAMTDADDSTWSSNFSMVAHAPALEFITAVVDDLTGNHNGIIDPGETVSVTVTLKNSGSGEANDVAGILLEDDTYISVGDESGTFGTLTGGGGTADNGGDDFILTADASCPRGHQVDFTVAVTGARDYGTTVTFSLIVGDRVPFYTDDFSYDQGWTGLGGSGEWTIGAATGGAGSDSYGGPDPSEDHTPTSDNGVLGNDLTSGTGGDYSSSLTSTYWTTSPVIDCSDFNGVTLSFWRWLGIEKSTYDHAYLQAYDGTSWVTVYENGSSDINETAWGLQEYDVSAVADSNPNFQVRFGIGATDGSYNYCGWNIDDLSLKGYGEVSAGEIALLDEEVSDSLIPGDTTVATIRVTNLGGTGSLRVRFSPTVSWITCVTDAQYIEIGDTLVFPVTIKSTDLTAGDYAGGVALACNDPIRPYDTVAVYLHLYAPAMAVEADSIAVTVSAGETATKPVVIANSGPGRLSYTVSCRMFDGAKASALPNPTPAGTRPADGDKSDATEPYFTDPVKGTGGPDQFGYGWVDSDEPGGPVYSWVDISGVGTAVTLTDDTAMGPYPIGFDFPFYENSYAEIYIGSNGNLMFGSGNKVRLNTTFPNATLPNNQIAIWWDDLDPLHSGTVYYYYDASDGRFIVSYNGVPNYANPTGTGSLSFQAILYPNGRIVLQYGTMDPGADADGLAGATIGVENAAGTDGLPVVYNAAYLHDDMAIAISAARWMSATPGSGAVEPYGTDTVVVSFAPGELADGVYHGRITVTGNDPVNPSAVLPVTMTVQSYVCGDATGDGQINVADAVYIINYVFRGGPAPMPLAAADATGDGQINVADAVYIINYVFRGGAAPVCE